jgi:hypothetical protein
MIDIQKTLRLVEPLIGRPYKEGAYGPEEFDCWGLAWYIEKELFDRELSVIINPSGSIKEISRLFRDHPEHRNWSVCEQPVHGGVIEMSHSRHPHHVGVWLDIDGGGILHAQCLAGVSFDPIIAMRAAGWRRFIFHDWVG